MKRQEVITFVRHNMMLDEQTDHRSVVGRGRPMSRELMLQTLDVNHPRWQQIPGMEKEVGDIITEALNQHNMA